MMQKFPDYIQLNLTLLLKNHNDNLIYAIQSVLQLISFSPYALYIFDIKRLVIAVCLGRGVIHKIAQWRDGNGRVQYLTVAILKPFRNVIRPIWHMLLHRVTSLRVS
jgi:hypothetical protein